MVNKVPLFYRIFNIEITQPIPHVDTNVNYVKESICQHNWLLFARAVALELRKILMQLRKFLVLGTWGMEQKNLSLTAESAGGVAVENMKKIVVRKGWE